MCREEYQLIYIKSRHVWLSRKTVWRIDKRSKKQIQITIWWWDEQACLDYNQPSMLLSSMIWPSILIFWNKWDPENQSTTITNLIQISFNSHGSLKLNWKPIFILEFQSMCSNLWQCVACQLETFHSTTGKL